MPGSPRQGARRGPRQSMQLRASRWGPTFLPQRSWGGAGVLSPPTPHPKDGIQAGKWKPDLRFLSCWPTRFSRESWMSPVASGAWLPQDNAERRTRH